MSHRVTTKTEIKDKAIALQAAKTADIGVIDDGSYLRFTGGALNNAVLDLKTGQITGDTDYGHTSEKLTSFVMYYNEAKSKVELAKQGIIVESREVNNGEITLYCAMG